MSRCLANFATSTQASGVLYTVSFCRNNTLNNKQSQALTLKGQSSSNYLCVCVCVCVWWGARGGSRSGKWA